MSFPANVKRVIQSIIPSQQRATGGIFFTMLPTGAGALGAAAKAVVAKTGAVTYQYGAVAAVITATANTTECWVEGLVITGSNKAAQSWILGVTTAAAVTAAAQVLAEVPFYINLVTDTRELMLPQRVFIPANKAIGLVSQCSATGGKTVNAWVLISRNK